MQPFVYYDLLDRSDPIKPSKSDEYIKCVKCKHDRKIFQFPCYFLKGIHIKGDECNHLCDECSRKTVRCNLCHKLIPEFKGWQTQRELKKSTRFPISYFISSRIKEILVCNHCNTNIQKYLTSYNCIAKNIGTLMLCVTCHNLAGRKSDNSHFKDTIEMIAFPIHFDLFEHYSNCEACGSRIIMGGMNGSFEYKFNIIQIMILLKHVSHGLEWRNNSKKFWIPVKNAFFKSFVICQFLIDCDAKCIIKKLLINLI